MAKLSALIFANGDFNNGKAVQKALALPEPRLIIAADGGLKLVNRLKLTPTLIIGDMDSVSRQALKRAAAQQVEIAKYPAAKDETDLELALIAAAKHDAQIIRIIGAVGNRQDQTLGNVYLLTLRELRKRDVRMVSHDQTTWLAQHGTTVVTGNPGDTLSLLPLAGNVKGIFTEGLEYPLNGETLHFGPARGMSNVLLGNEARISFEGGLLLLVHTEGRA